MIRGARLLWSKADRFTGWRFSGRLPSAEIVAEEDFATVFGYPEHVSSSGDHETSPSARN